jgi:hypothetical protein
MPKFLRELFGDLPPWGRAWLYVGLAALLWAALMSWSFGYEISVKHASFLVCLSIVAAALPDAARHWWDEGRYGIGAILGLIAVPVLIIEFYTHAGYTAGLRGSNVETAQVQNMRHAGAQNTAAENAALLASFKKQLEKFRSENEWTTTASADALRKQIAVHDKEIENEAARKGCKTKCEALMRKKAETEAKIATIESGNALVAKIEAMQKLVDSKRDVAATVEHKSSAVAHQNQFLAKNVALLWSGSLTPSDLMSEGTQQSVNLAMALAGTGLPALALFVAGLYRRPTRRDEEDEAIVAGQAQAARPRMAGLKPVAYSASTRSIADLRQELMGMRAAA